MTKLGLRNRLYIGKMARSDPSDPLLGRRDPLPPSVAARGILRSWLRGSHRSRFIGRTAQLAELVAAARRGRLRASGARLRRRRVGRRQEPPARRADRARRRARRSQPRRRQRRARRRRAPVRAAGRPRCARSCAQATPCWTGSRTRAAAELARLVPELGQAPGRVGWRPRRLAAPLRRRARADRRARRGGHPTASCCGSRTSTGRTARRARSCASSPRTCAASAFWSCSPTARTSFTAATRCARCWPSSSGPRAPCGSSSLASIATSSPTSSPTSSASRPTRRWSQRMHARSDGNPLFTEELLAAGADGLGSLPPEPARGTAPARRAPRLSSAQQLLRLLAVVGRAGHNLLAEAAGVDPSELSAAMREAIEAQIVITDGEGRFAFRHALLREVLYDDLLPGERAELHLALARALERMRGGHDEAWIATGDRPPLQRRRRPAGRAEGRGRGGRGGLPPAGLPRGGGDARPRRRAVAASRRPGGADRARPRRGAQRAARGRTTSGATTRWRSASTSGRSRRSTPRPIPSARRWRSTGWRPASGRSDAPSAAARPSDAALDLLTDAPALPGARPAARPEGAVPAPAGPLSRGPRGGAGGARGDSPVRLRARARRRAQPARPRPVRAR